MLVLTRSVSEEIRIGHDIVIRVLEVRGDRVRIGIAAPATVPVHRQEVYEEIERTNREALEVAGGALEGARELLKHTPGVERATQASPNRKRGRGASRNTLNTEVRHGTYDQHQHSGPYCFAHARTV